jgi:hypothetical protein
MPIEDKFFPNLFFLLLSVRTFTSVFKDKEPLRTAKSRFLLIFCLLMEESGSGAGSLQNIADPDPGGPKT